MRSPTSTSLGHFSEPREPALPAARPALGDGQAGQQRQPGPAIGVAPPGASSTDMAIAGARRRGPGPALPAPAGRLVVGDQHAAGRLAGAGPGRQIGVGRAGLGHQIDPLPQAAGRISSRRRRDRSIGSASGTAATLPTRQRRRAAYRDDAYTTEMTRVRVMDRDSSAPDIHTTAGKLADLDQRIDEAVHAGLGGRGREAARQGQEDRPRADRAAARSGLVHRAGRVRPAPLDVVRDGEAAAVRRRGGHRLRHHRRPAGLRVQPGRHGLRRQPRPGLRREDRQDHRLRAEDRLPDDRAQRGRRRPDPGGRGLPRPLRRDLPPQHPRRPGSSRRSR